MSVATPHLPTGLAELAEFRYELRRFLSFSESAAEQQGIAAQQYQLLQVVGAAPQAGKTSITYIAERMLLRHNSAVELVDRAVKAGLVERLSDPADQRRSIVGLTEQGHRILAELVSQHLKELSILGPKLISALQVVTIAGGKEQAEGE